MSRLTKLCTKRRFNHRPDVDRIFHFRFIFRFFFETGVSQRMSQHFNELDGCIPDCSCLVRMFVFLGCLNELLCETTELFLQPVIADVYEIY